MADLRKMQAPDYVLRVEIDDPADQRIENTEGVIRGWFAARDMEIQETFRFRIDGLKLPHRVVRREDVELAMPGHLIVGFEIPYDLLFYLPYIQNHRLTIEMIAPNYGTSSFRFQIAGTALAMSVAAAGGV
jgi:hypothetical protein